MVDGPLCGHWSLVWAALSTRYTPRCRPSRVCPYYKRMPVKRAAHRPSRKRAVVQAAMRLHAAGPLASVMVADIAAEAKMTAAAVYYHYATKEDIIVDGLTAFAAAIS